MLMRAVGAEPVVSINWISAWFPECCALSGNDEASNVGSGVVTILALEATLKQEGKVL